ncbi:Ig-like domain-containing protein [bacterium]|nr:Ig-like domain-containing protein [bacterium]
MSCQKQIKLIPFCLVLFCQTVLSQIVLQGVVINNGAEYLGSGSEPVANVLVTLTNQSDTTQKFSAYTNADGKYSIQILETGVYDHDSKIPKRLYLFQNYPNPFNPATVIGYELSKPTHIRIEIYNVLGQRIRTLIDGFQTGWAGHVIWDATDDYGQGVSAGVYIYSLKAEGIRINKKMLLIDGQQGKGNVAPTRSMRSDESKQIALLKKTSDQYLLQVTGGTIETYEQSNLVIAASTTLNVTVIRTMADIDGNVYRTVKIGDQWWMVENLKVTHYRNGDEIPNVTDNTLWSSLTTGACCAYDNNEEDVATYGRLYNWHTVDDSRNIAPEGWHVPTDEEWKELEMTLGMSQSEVDNWALRGTDEGCKLKETGTTHWTNPNTGATNESGFTALSSGSRLGENGHYGEKGHTDIFRSSTESNLDFAIGRGLSYNDSKIARHGYLKKAGFPVRLVRNSDSTLVNFSIEITPDVITLKNGENQQFTCTVIYTDQSAQDVTPSVSWLLSQGNIGSIDAGGLFTAHATNTGTETITATYDGVTALATVTVSSGSFVTGTVTDIDGNVYRTVKIGNQWWMAENLKVTHYRNGHEIPTVTDDTNWLNLRISACCAYNNDERYVTTYGRLYNWYAVDDSRNIAPEGWHVPTDEDWKELEIHLGMSQSDADSLKWRGTIVGGKLKEMGITHWHTPNEGATNESGFSALPGGYRLGYSGSFHDLGGRAIFWTSTEHSNNYTWRRCLEYDNSGIYRGYNGYKRSGYSVRLIRD